MSDDLRLIEDYLPIEAISAEASREKSVRKGHISTLHLWWARRPLVACRAAVYGALVPADRWVKDVELKDAPEDGKKGAKTKNGKKKGLNRKAAKEFVTKLCRYPKTDPTSPADIKIKRETEAAIVEAQQHILEAHADRLTAELGEAAETGKPPTWVEEFEFAADKVTYDDIVAGRAPRPRVLDMFAGGGAIPLEALWLGCEAYALDLNPVAHIIELCTLVYPQKYGKPDPSVRGMTGPKNDRGETTWGGLAAEVRHWGKWVLDRVYMEIGDLYPPIPDPAIWSKPPTMAFERETGQWKVTEPGKLKRDSSHDALGSAPSEQAEMYDADEEEKCAGEVDAVAGRIPPGFLQTVAYLWTRTVRCKNPKCGAIVPLVKQTWLCKKQGRFAAFRPDAEKRAKHVVFTVVESDSERSLGFDPEAFAIEGSATCFYCGTVADAEYVQSQGVARLTSQQLMGAAFLRPRSTGKIYLGAGGFDSGLPEDPAVLRDRTAAAAASAGVSTPFEAINPIRPSPNSRGISGLARHGVVSFGDLFNPRQMLSLLTFCAAIKESADAMAKAGVGEGLSAATSTLLGAMLDRLADFCCKQCTWNYTGGRGVGHAFTKQNLAMVWDYAETNPFNPEGASWPAAVADIPSSLAVAAQSASRPAVVHRGVATALPWREAMFDAVLTDPPYYDNVPYADVSDFFYVWLKRSVGHLHPEHFGGDLTPKKQEATALASRHCGDMAKATAEYENAMFLALREASRVLKQGGSILTVYAHKTTLGWATLVDALRRAGFNVVEAWPLDTERKARMLARDAAALASSIFLVARKRETDAPVGNYEDDVQPKLKQIVRERVETLWDMGIVGADLVIACVGAGLRPFTRYEKVEYANGEEVPAEKFLAEVEGVVLDTMMGKLFGQSGATVSTIDPPSRFYVLWRSVYKASEIDAGEAIVFTDAQHVELDGPQGLSTGKDALVDKKKAKYRARDFTERGDNDKLGMPSDDGKPAPLIDSLHRVLWLMENRPRKLAEFLNEASPDRERLRVLAQALAGAALSGKAEEDAERLIGTTAAEKSALGKLLANWRSIVENAVVPREERAERARGQKRLFE